MFYAGAQWPAGTQRGEEIIEALFESTVLFDEPTLTEAYGRYFAYKRRWVHAGMLVLAGAAVLLGIWCLVMGQYSQAALCALVAAFSAYRVFFANKSLVQRSAAADEKPQELRLVFGGEGVSAGRRGQEKFESYTGLTLCLHTQNLALLEFGKKRLLVVDLNRFTKGEPAAFLSFLRGVLPAGAPFVEGKNMRENDKKA